MDEVAPLKANMNIRKQEGNDPLQKGRALPMFSILFFY